MNSPLDILLVDDSESDVKLFILAHRANKSTATIMVARDGQEALDSLIQSETLPQLVLLDINMPRVNGFDVLEQLRADERTRLLPVIIFSSSHQKGDVERAHRLGANACLTKPMGFYNLCQFLANLERDWIRTNFTK